MGRFILIITVVWSLVGAPMLCRAGVLVRCCAEAPNEQAPADRAGCERGCCSSPSDKAPARDSGQRECDSCATLCDAVAKPIDDDPLAGPSQLAADTVCLGFVAAVTTSLPQAPAPYRPPDILRVRFPFSDIPLLI